MHPVGRAYSRRGFGWGRHTLAYSEVKVCEVREKIAYLLTCPTVAKHLSFVPLPLLPSL